MVTKKFSFLGDETHHTIQSTLAAFRRYWETLIVTMDRTFVNQTRHHPDTEIS